MFALSLTIYEISAKQIKCEKFDLEYEGHGQGIEKRDFRHSTGNVRIYVIDFLRNLATWEHVYTKIKDARAHTRTVSSSNGKGEILLYTWSDFQRVDWLNSFTLKSAYLLFKIISKPKLKFYVA